MSEVVNIEFIAWPILGSPRAVGIADWLFGLGILVGHLLVKVVLEIGVVLEGIVRVI